jgi:hypothetical protein
MEKTRNSGMSHHNGVEKLGPQKTTGVKHTVLTIPATPPSSLSEAVLAASLNHRQNADDSIIAARLSYIIQNSTLLTLFFPRTVLLQQ